MSNNILEILKKKYPLDNKEVKDIVLDTLTIKEITPEEKEYLENFKNVKVFSFNLTKLKSLNNLPQFPNLSEIELSDNLLSGEELHKLIIYPEIKKIRLANNKIKQIKDLDSFQHLTQLNFLDLSQNPINSIENYRKKIFELIPSLNFLDMQDKEGKAYSDFEEEEDENEEKEDEEEEKEDSFFIDDKKEKEGKKNENEEEEFGEEEFEEEEKENEDYYKPGKKRKLK